MDTFTEWMWIFKAKIPPAIEESMTSDYKCSRDHSHREHVDDWNQIKIFEDC
jgi:hypothetical protein